MTTQLEDYTDEFGRTRQGHRSYRKGNITTTETNLLAETDWMYVRKKERDIDVPLDVISERSAIQTEADRIRTAIDAATTYEEVEIAFSSANFA
jgi:hypothetical protein